MGKKTKKIQDENLVFQRLRRGEEKNSNLQWVVVYFMLSLCVYILYIISRNHIYVCIRHCILTYSIYEIHSNKTSFVLFLKMQYSFYIVIFLYANRLLAPLYLNIL